MANVLNTRLSRLEGRSGTGAVMVAVFDHDEAQKVRELASVHDVSPLIVVTGVPRREAIDLARVSAILGRGSREGGGVPVHA